MLMIIEEVPISKNEYVNQHWAKRRNYKADILEKMEDWKSFHKEFHPEMLKGLPYKKATVLIDIYFKTKRKRDIHNYVGGGLISWIDCLVELGIIADDCYDCIGQPIITFEYDKECPRTEVQIERRK